MDVVLALLAATAFATGTVLQQRGTLQVPAAEDDPRFLIQILHRPVWLCGASLQGLGWVLQAAALEHGPLVVVQALTTLSLVIALPIGYVLTDQPLNGRILGGALATVLGVVCFLSVGSPAAGTAAPGATVWWTAILVAAAVVAVLALAALRRRGATRALLLGAAAGVGFGLQAAVTKVFVTLLGLGLVTLLTSWTTYVLVGSAVLGFVLQQSALRTGALAPAMASSNVSCLLVSVVLGVAVFGESLSQGSGRLAPAILGLVACVGGIAVLTAAEATAQGQPAVAA